MKGQAIAHYRVTAKIGAGGMGEVYRATDTKLGREVALKVLPQAFAQDEQRMQRFQREAQVLASLNHPNIATIYGLEHAEKIQALAMELVEGPTLAERIRQGAIPIEEALPVAKQIAEALEYAHEKGIIHRDLKPANIKVTADGQVKILDFGLAKAMADDATSGLDIGNSPTLSLAATKAGLILGTAAYMPPEQAKGKHVDRRADIWSFGCVLYEMLSGQRAYPGEHVSETLAAVIRGEPDWNALPLTPAHSIAKLLRRCLEKDTKRRLQAIGEARLAIEDYLANPAAADAFASGAAQAGAHPARASRVAWTIAAIATGAALLLAVAYFRTPAEQPRVVRAFIPAPPEVFFDFANSPFAGPPALSPDGRFVVFAAHVKDEPQMLWLRAIDSVTAQALPGTDGASFPFWSPDNRTVGFFAGESMKKIEVSGGSAITLCTALTGRGGTWNRDGVIVFGPDANSPLHRVAAAGGTSHPVTQLNQQRGEHTHRWPHFLPDGKHFLYLARVGQGGAGLEGTGIWVASLEGGPPKLLIQAASKAEYAAGHILYARENTLMAQPFNPNTLELTGDAFPIADRIQHDVSFSRGTFSVSENGVLLYQTGEFSPGTSLVWFDRRGKRIGTLGDPSVYVDVRISPDGRRVAAAVTDPRIGPPDVWIFEVARGLRTRFTFHSNQETHPVWSPDGERLAYRGTNKGIPDIYVKSLAGAGQESPLLESMLAKYPSSWSSDGRFLAYESRGTQTATDIWTLPLGEKVEPKLYLATQFREGQPHFSPDGRWMAYVSDESGRNEVYVAPFPGPGRKWQISTSGGVEPRWRRDGREIFYIATSNNDVTAVEVNSRGDTFEVGAAKTLFQPLPLRRGNVYDVTGDGQRFLVNLLLQEQTSEPMTLVINWPAALKNKK